MSTEDNQMTFQQMTTTLASQSREEIIKATNNWILSFPTTSGRYDAVLDCLKHADEHAEVVEEIVGEAWAILKQKRLWAEHFHTEREALAALETPGIKSMRASHERRRARAGKSITTIRGMWGEDTKDWNFDNLKEEHLRQMARAATRIPDVNKACSLLVRVVIERLERNRGGQGMRRVVIGSDWGNIADLSNDEVLATLERPAPLPALLEAYEFAPADLDLFALMHKTIEPNSSEEPMRRKRYRPRSPTDAAMSNTSTEEDVETGSDSDLRDNAEEDDENVVQPAPRRKKDKQSDCLCVGVEHGLIERMERSSASEANMRSTTDCLKVIYYLLSTSQTNDLRHVCFRHIRNVASHLGLSISVPGLNADLLRNRLKQSWEKRVSLELFKKEHPTWWKMGFRDSTDADSLGAFRYPAERTTLLIGYDEKRANEIVDELAGSGAWETWKEDGTIVAEGFFDWLWNGIRDGESTETGIGSLIDLEFDLYKHHLGERNGKPNLGWQRNMLYSLSQQIIRGDIGYWLLYSALRPDRNCQLVSYPYYTKFASEGDNTLFRHIDMNVPRYLESGRGGSIIQGSVSLDDETEDGCTVVVKGFHRNLQSWYQDVRNRGGELSDAEAVYIHSLKDKNIWSKEDAEKYGDFSPVVCKQGDVRITRPEIIHGSTAKGAPGKRRTILPWFVGISSDGTTLDNPASESLEELTICHNLQRAPAKSPSGLHNKYARVMEKFPASTQLPFSSPISNALLCRTSWKDPRVQAEANILLGTNRQAAKAKILEQRIDALRSFKQSWRYLPATEKLSFPSNSFFK